METDKNSSRESSQAYDYTVDGGIPDAQFDEAMNALLEDALEDDPRREQRGLSSQRENQHIDEDSEYHEEDSEYQEDEVSARVGEDSDAPGSPSASDLSDSEHVGRTRHTATQPRISSSIKRPMAVVPFEMPFKRKCTELRAGYLNLLNMDIKEAAHRGCTEDRDIDEDGVTAYRASQLGLTVWSPVEKRILYEATSRLGRSAVSDIAAWIGTKSVVEVEDYLIYLHHASEERKTKLRPILQPAERPAAIELSPQCCHALDEAADTLSIMQERKEQKREEKKWGDSWNITQSSAEKAEQENEEKLLNEGVPDFNDLFDISMWLGLSSDVFMNSAVPSNNWNYVDEASPSIWATAMEDFHSLALSITRRIVQTTLCIAMSRIRSKRELEPRILGIVRREDVEAALMSLNMEDQRQAFWRDSARRLRLNVLDNETGSRGKRVDEDEQGYMTYDAVEDALRNENDREEPTRTPAPRENSAERSADGEGALEDYATEQEADVEPSGPPTPSERLSPEELAVRDEAEEVILYSGVDFPRSTRSKEVLLNRISGEMRQEEYANRCDEIASKEGEVKMWELLDRPVPQVLRVKEAPAPLPRSNLGVEGVYSVGRNWRRGLRYHAEWETQETDGKQD